ncbi:Sulfotransferase 1C4 [Armadillidium nasatum]|uniref:Sulfotransferase 1C4 n=1 Tax=Armadillidium nasatum TaxID=96803 RepID=A0A5N5SXQ3_9CRUS|nr:Sulfotransferase 1C4 [Armadillidium nasatum]
MLKSGHRIVCSSLKEYEKVYDDFEAHRVGTVRLQPGNWFFTTPFINYADQVYDFKLKPSDVVVVTYPKCGTTWTQEIVWTILKNRNLDNPKASIPINARCPFIEFDFLMNHHGLPIFEPGQEIYDGFHSMYPDRNPDDGIFLQLAELAEDPRVIKSHLPLSLLPPSLLDTSKVLYIARNPRDVTISYHHHSRLIRNHNYTGNLDSFVDHMINDRLMFSPYWEHIKEGWNKRNHPNMLFCFYEDMKADPKKEIDRIAKFINVDLTETQLDNIVSFTSFDAMKNRTEVVSWKKDASTETYFNNEVFQNDGGFFRKGQVNDWKSKLSEEQIQKLEEWSKKNCEDFDDDFKYKKM